MIFMDMHDSLSMKSAIEHFLNIPVVEIPCHSGRLSVTGEPFIVFCNGYIKPEGAPIVNSSLTEPFPVIWERTLHGLKTYRDWAGKNPVLYWRQLPTWKQEITGTVLFLRCLISSKSPVDDNCNKKTLLSLAIQRAFEAQPRNSIRGVN